MFTSDLIHERDIPALAPERPRWAELEARLVRFTADLAAQGVDEADEAGIAIPFPQMDVHLDRTPVAG